MNNFLDLFAFVKGVEYLIAIAFIIVFTLFWYIVYGNGKRLTLKIVLLAYLVLGFVLMLGSCLAARPQ
jgi:uncharacterized protein (UPF0218 family)